MGDSHSTQPTRLQKLLGLFRAAWALGAAVGTGGVGTPTGGVPATDVPKGALNGDGQERGLANGSGRLHVDWEKYLRLCHTDQVLCQVQPGL